MRRDAVVRSEAKLEDVEEKHKILSKNQFDFRNNISTDDALINVTGKIINELDIANKCLGIFLDLRKAFDTINHNLLLDKLHTIGVRVGLRKITFVRDRAYFLGFRTKPIREIFCEMSTSSEKDYVFPNSSHSCHYRRYRTYRHVLFRMNAVLARQLLCLLGYTPLRKCSKIEFSSDERVMERRKFSPAPGFEPGFSALRADALSTKPRRIQPRRR
ncbi:hypothetical protein ANN_10332 [Periplaneta americana]|uniref:Reverse transcriptase domain-containing protein n=1 Tax=Periplaneta americana TaxID=6978 RepID=A0ABQ8TP01_PERAM|nr:hypothetical protein ANN_10332 [Periplaneta americana]